MMSESLAFLVIKAVWRRIIEIFESLLVPELSSEVGMKPLEEVAILQYALKSFGIFFHGEGNGLPSEDIRIPRSIQLKQIMDHYSLSKNELQEKYIFLNQEPNAFIEKDGLLTTDWILKLLKLKSDHEFCERALKARTSQTVLKS